MSVNAFLLENNLRSLVLEDNSDILNEYKFFFENTPLFDRFFSSPNLEFNLTEAELVFVKGRAEAFIQDARKEIDLLKSSRNKHLNLSRLALLVNLGCLIVVLVSGSLAITVAALIVQLVHLILQFYHIGRAAQAATELRKIRSKLRSVKDRVSESKSKEKIQDLIDDIDGTLDDPNPGL
jgi:hypothetical protein